MRFIASVIIKVGVGILLLGIALLLIIFYPIIMQELSYDLGHIKANIASHQTFSTTNTQITPVDTDFGIVIPKIKANSKVIPQVDPYDEVAYQKALTQGVAHAKGSALPYENGNVFLFSHSSVNFYEAQKYNSIFYLLYKLEKGDIIDIYYAGDKYEYTVTGKKIVNPDAVSYLSDTTDNTLTLMTCWPPGTSFQRLLVEAQKSGDTQQ